MKPLTPAQIRAMRILDRIGSPMKASAFGQAMWPNRYGFGADPRRNLLAGGYLSKLHKKGLVDRVQNPWDDSPRYVPSEEGLRLLKEEP